MKQYVFNEQVLFMKSNNIIYLKKDKPQIQQMRARTPHKKGSLQLERERRPDIINSSYVFSTSINNSLSNNNSLTLNNHSSILHSTTQQSTVHQHQVQIQIPLNYTQSIHTKNSQLALSTKNNHINYVNPNKSANYSHPNNSSIQTNTNKMSLVKKYIQQEMLQARTNKYSLPKEKEYREVVISDEFIRSHKLYKMLKEQISVADARFVRQTNTLNQTLDQQTKKVKDIKDGNHKMKVQLWELKNQLMQLKGLIEEEQEQNKRLVEQYDFANNQRQGEYQQGQGQGQGQGQEGDLQEGEDGGQGEQQGEKDKQIEKIEKAEDDQEEKRQIDEIKLECSRNIDILKHNLEQIKNEDRQEQENNCSIGRQQQEIGELEGLQLNQSIQYKQSQKQKQI